MKEFSPTRWWLCLFLFLLPATAYSADVVVPVGNTVVVIEVASLVTPTTVPVPSAQHAIYYPGEVASRAPAHAPVSLCIRVIQTPMPLNGLVRQTTSTPPVIVVIDVPVTQSVSNGYPWRRMW